MASWSRERLHLMEKLHVSISGWKPPGCRARHKAGLCLRVLQKPAPIGERLRVVPEPLPSVESQALAEPPPRPLGVLQLPLSLRGVHSGLAAGKVSDRY